MRRPPSRSARSPLGSSPDARPRRTRRIGGVDTTSFPALRVDARRAARRRAAGLRENGHPVAGLEASTSEREKTIVLALDRSQSMRGRPLANAIAAGRRFTGDLGRRDHVGVVAFGRSAIALDRPSAPGRRARPARRPRASTRKSGTALYDAIVARRATGSQGVSRSGPRDRRRHRRPRCLEPLVVPATRSHAAAHAHAAVYAIGIGGPDFTPAPLRELASRTGGTYRRPRRRRPRRHLPRASNELARTWQLTYLTSARPGATIQLTAARPGVGARPRRSTLPSSGSSAVDAADAA